MWRREVVANHTLDHIPELDLALPEIRGVLRPGRRLSAATTGRGQLRVLGALLGETAWNDDESLALETVRNSLSAASGM